MKITTKFSLSLLAIFFAGCAINSQSMQKCEPNSECTTPQSIAGVYKTTLPCADCDGIDATLTLTKDAKFSLEYAYQTPDNEKELQEGSYELIGANLTTTNHYKEQQKFKLENGNIKMLNADGSEAQSPLDKHYIFKRVK